MKCECGRDYVRDDPADEEAHARVHAEYTSGPEIRAMGQLSPCETYSAFPIYEIDETYPIATRRELANVDLVVCQSTGYPRSYDGTASKSDQRLYIATHNAHVIAMVVTARDDRFWRLGWGADGSIIRKDPATSRHQSYKVARAWTAGDYRRRGLAIRLIQTASRLLPCSITDLGWELPFTPDGKHLVETLCPEMFWACGTPFALLKTLGKDRQ